MRLLRRIVVRLLILTLLVGGGYAVYQYAATHPEVVEDAQQFFGLSHEEASGEGVAASGTLEADTVRVMSLIPARVISITVQEGDDVHQGDVLIVLDDSLLQKQLTAAQAGIEVARAQLALLEAGPRPEEVAKAQAQLRAAQVAVDVAAQALADARAMRDAAQDVWPDIIRAETEYTKTLYLRDAALAQAHIGDLNAQLWEEINNQVKAGQDIVLPGGQVRHVEPPPEKVNEVSFRWNLASQQEWQAWAKYHQAQAAVEVALSSLKAARSKLTDPARDLPVAQALAAYEKALAAVPVAQSALDALNRGVNAEKIETARANLRRAQAAYDRLAASRRFYTLRAPVSGLVLKRSIEVGEVASPGVPLLEIGDLDNLHVTLYVAEKDLGRIHLGDDVVLKVDSYPNRVFHGQVVHIADRAEFTPRNVQTQEDRVILLYAVKVDVPNPDHALKAGMPVDAIIGVSTWPTPEMDSHLTASTPGEEQRQPATPLTVSGSFEGSEVRIMSEVSARVEEVTVQEGDTVSPGQVVAHLDPGTLPQEVAEAEAGLAAARAQLADLLAQPLPSQVDVARSQVSQAEAEVRAARITLESARAALAHPTELDNQILLTKSQLSVLAHRLDEARALRKAAVVERDYYASDMSPQGRKRYAMAVEKVSAADANIRAVQAEIEGTRRLLSLLEEIRRNPLALKSQVHRAEGQVRLAQAQLEVARKSLALASSPARPEEVAMSRARVAQAKATRDLLLARLTRYTLSSPQGGTVTSCAVGAGEVVPAGGVVCNIASLDVLDLIVFVPEEDLGRVRVGQRVDVTVDTYPGRVFPGVVVWISPKAEFTPKNVQTKKDRVDMVYRVKIRVPNPDGILKPGMPADATFKEGA